MFLLKLAFKNLTRHKRRTLITSSVIAMAIFTYIFIDSLMLGMENLSYDNIINLETAHVQISNPDYWEKREELALENLIKMDDNIIKEIKKLDSFSGYAKELKFSARLNNGIEEIPVSVLGIEAEEYLKIYKTEDYLIKGDFFKKGENGAVLGNSLANLMELKAGDYITLLFKTKEGTYNTIDTEIKGIVNTSHPTINDSTVYVPLNRAYQALNLDGELSRISVRLKGSKHTASALATFNEAFSSKSNIKAFSWRDSAQAVIAMSQAQNLENLTILGIILIIAVVGIINTIILSALERMEEIGMMKALGMKEKEIIFSFMVEATGIGILGGLLGILLSVIGISIFNIFGLNLETFAGEEFLQMPMLGRIYCGWNINSFVFVVTFAIVVTFLASFFPALWAARKDPVKSIYHR